MKNIVRTTEVISVSLSPKTARKLEEERRKKGQSRSAFIASLIDKTTEDERWEEIYKMGERIARCYKITSEDDIDRILHEA